MIQKKAPFSGMFTPRVNNGDCVISRQVIGTILFGDEFRQLANGSGEINNILSRQDVDAGAVLCEIDDDSAKCLAVNEPFLSGRLAKRITQRPKKKATKITAKKSSGKSEKKTAKKSIKPTAKKTSKKRGGKKRK